jgi:flagellar export protein FliJ
MAFHFPLETLLRLQVSYERKERRILEELARKVAATRQRIEEIEQERRTAARHMSEHLLHGLTASEMHFASACDSVLEEQHRRWASQLVELEKEYRQQQAVYLEARQKREILEGLRERQAAEYRRERERREQQAMDDLFLMRAGRNELPGQPASLSALPSGLDSES